MRPSRRSWWVLYALGVLLTTGALGWITLIVLELERKGHEARCDAEHQEALRLSLWRMDSWFAPQLAREAARPYYEYLPFYAQERAYSRLLNRIEPGEVLSPSPLLTLRSDLTRLHFQVDQRGGWSSPQVPERNLLDLAQATLVDPGRIEACRAELERLGRTTTRGELEGALLRAENELATILDEPLRDPSAEELAQQGVESPQWLKNQRETSKRAQSSYQKVLQIDGGQPPSQEAGANWGVASGDTIEIGPLVPIWLAAGGEEPEICYVRRVRGGEHELLQGFLADWPPLSSALLAQVADLLPGARLLPVGTPAATEIETGLQLAAIPARLEAPVVRVPLGTGLTPARAGLLISWGAVLAAAVAVALSLRSSIAYGEKRSRFASTVTHELRTPLTTFRMYSEMLARGMVPEEKRAEYLDTLQRESDRLSGLVENVLAYARMEEGRAALRRERIAVPALLERAAPALERHARESGVPLELEAGGVDAVAVETDPEAVQQILFNLVDNACKYGRSADGAPVVLSARELGGRVELRVRDHGEGVPRAAVGSIFRPFERGACDPADPRPGVGLGLALSRRLARELGGDLRLEIADGAGACFCLSLGRAS